jgi:hypothetical protein
VASGELRMSSGFAGGLAIAYHAEWLCRGNPRSSGTAAEVAVFGTLSETYRTCGRAGCLSQQGGPKHGPHLN